MLYVFIECVKGLRRQCERWERKFEGQGRIMEEVKKWSDWWSEEIRRVAESKKEYLLVWRRTGIEEALGYYRKFKRVVKRMVGE